MGVEGNTLNAAAPLSQHQDHECRKLPELLTTASLWSFSVFCGAPADFKPVVGWREGTAGGQNAVIRLSDNADIFPLRLPNRAQEQLG